MPADWAEFLTRNRHHITTEWASRLKIEVSELYFRRPIDELRDTVAAAFDANYQALGFDQWNDLNRFIDKISRMRLEGGFPLVDVQKAFTLFRSIVLPLLVKTEAILTYHQSVMEIDNCLSYTIYQFSNHFQELHRRHLVDHAQKLKTEVQMKTRELRESELTYKTLVEEITDGYVVIQNDMIVFTNDTFNSMHEYGPSDLIGKHFLDLAATVADREAIQRQLSHAPVDRIHVKAVEYNRKTRSGNQFPTEIKFKSALYADQWSQIGICRDVTDRVEYEKKMREADRLADIAQIATSLSHEIRNPLSAIKMNLQILQRHPQLVGNDRRRIDIAVHEMHRLEGILQDVLDFAKPVVLNRQMVFLNSVLTQAVDLMELKIRERQLDIRLDMQELPEMWIDGQKIEQVALNLLLNAVDAAPENSTIRVGSQFASTDTGPSAEFWFENEGQNMDPGLCEKIFKPFFTTKSKGAGLGLSVVKRLVEAHGGRISVRNRIPSGSIFSVILPTGVFHGDDPGY
ncbi:MAG: ATP-binding protein [Desulfatirhabdiaceae bacterium]